MLRNPPSTWCGGWPGSGWARLTTLRSSEGGSVATLLQATIRNNETRSAVKQEYTNAFSVFRAIAVVKQSLSP
jgi:hypothetical protein